MRNRVPKKLFRVFAYALGIPQRDLKIRFRKAESYTDLARQEGLSVEEFNQNIQDSLQEILNHDRALRSKVMYKQTLRQLIGLPAH